MVIHLEGFAIIAHQTTDSSILRRYWDSWDDQTPSEIRNIIFKRAYVSRHNTDAHKKSILLSTPHIIVDSFVKGEETLAELECTLGVDDLKFINTYGFAYASNFAMNDLSSEMRLKGEHRYSESRMFISYFSYKYNGKSYRFGIGSTTRSMVECLTDIKKMISKQKGSIINQFIKHCREAVKNRSK